MTKRYELFTFNASGFRSLAYGNLTQKSLIDAVMKYSKNLDVLVTEYSPENIKVITELEHSLKRRANKQEILKFIANGFTL